jgi:hypothetical protein
MSPAAAGPRAFVETARRVRDTEPEIIERISRG